MRKCLSAFDVTLSSGVLSWSREFHLQEALKTSTFWYVRRESMYRHTYSMWVSAECLQRSVTFCMSNSIRWWLPTQMLSCQLQQILRDLKLCYDHFLSAPSPREQLSCSSYYLVTLLLLHYCYIVALRVGHMGTQPHSSDWRHHSNGEMEGCVTDGNVGLKSFIRYKS